MEFKLYCGDVIQQLHGLPDKSINTCVTSPPYYGLRDYGIDNQIGLEETPEEYINKLVEVFREVKRVLRDDGILWVNIGDSYVSKPPSHRNSSNMQDVYYTPAEFTERSLFETNIKPDRLENYGEDLLFQIMTELGIELSAKIEKKEIAGKTVWNVCDGYLMACFDEGVNETTITEVARQHPHYFVMRDSSMATDNVADNFEQIWEEYSNETIRRIL